MDIINDLYEMCDIIGEALHEANDKIRKAGGKLSAGDVTYIDQITHAMKSVKTTIAMLEGGYSKEGNGSYDGGSYFYRGNGEQSYRGSYRGRSMDVGSMDGGRSMDGNGSREGGGNSARGYSRYGSGMAGMIEELRNLTDETPDQRTRRELQHFIEKLEQM